jgi:hypothetical protein
MRALLTSTSMTSFASSGSDEAATALAPALRAPPILLAFPQAIIPPECFRVDPSGVVRLFQKQLL